MIFLVKPLVFPKALTEVWSTTDGHFWESSGDAPWPARAGFGLAADEKQIYLAGGQSCWEHPGTGVHPTCGCQGRSRLSGQYHLFGCKMPKSLEAWLLIHILPVLEQKRRGDISKWSAQISEDMILARHDSGGLWNWLSTLHECGKHGKPNIECNSKF